MKSLLVHALFVSVAVIGSSLVAHGAGEADSSPPVEAPPAEDDDRFTLRAGAFLLSGVKVTLGLDGSGGQIGDEINLEEDLGGDDHLSIFRADAEWRFARRHRVGLSWFDIDQQTTHTLSRDIEWGDETFPVNATVETQFRTMVSKLNYGYTFYSKGRHELTGLIGAHITKFEAGLSAPNLGRTEGVNATAPLPVIGLEWKAQLSDRLTTRISYEYFGISIDSKYSGSLSDFLVILDYRLGSNWYIGGGYNRYVLRASVESERLELTARHSYNGLIAFISTSF
jgi:hypothetical protein